MSYDNSMTYQRTQRYITRT